MKKILCVVLILVMALSMTANAFAETIVSKNTNTYVVEELNTKYERTISKTGIVTVSVKNADDNSILTEIKNIGGKIYVDGELFLEVPNLFRDSSILKDETSGISLLASNEITWRSWSSWNTVVDNYPTGGVSMAVLYGVVAAACPWVTFRAISAALGVIAAKYDYITVKVRIRYGDDGKLFYYHRQIRLYGDNVLVKTIEDKGSEKL